VLSAIELDDQHALNADKIDNIVTKRMLAAKAVVVQLFVA